MQKFSPIFVFLFIILATDMLESHSRALSKDVDFGLISEKNLSQNSGSMGWSPGSGEGGQKNAKTPPLLAFHPDNPKPKTKNFFSISTRRLDECVEGLNSSLAQSPGEL